jgi:hypothetical protein
MFAEVRVRVEQSRQLHRNFFTAARGPGNAARFCHIRCHVQANSAEQLHALRDGVHQFRLDAICKKTPATAIPRRFVFISFIRSLLIAWQRILRRLQVATKGL